MGVGVNGKEMQRECRCRRTKHLECSAMDSIVIVKLNWGLHIKNNNINKITIHQEH